MSDVLNNHLILYTNILWKIFSIVVDTLKCWKLVLCHIVLGEKSYSAACMLTDHSHVMEIVFKILKSTIFITLFTILEYSYYLLNNVVTNSLSLINAFQCIFHHLKITIVVREGENETHGFNGEFHEKNGSSSWSGDEKSWQNTFVLLWSSAPIVKISNPKEISFEFIHFCPLVRSDEIALLHASLNNISLQSFLFSLL